MKPILFLLMLFQIGCATKYILPANRFMTPESEGGAFNSRFEFQQTSGNQLTADLSNGSIEEGVLTQQISRSAYLFSTSFFEQFDFFWSHTGAGNSLFGGKFQFLGPSRKGGAGHKMAVTGAFGGNEHEIEGSTNVKFELTGQEFQLLYGYRFGETVMAYTNLSYASYNFSGSVNSSDIVIDGLEPKYQTKIYAIYGGMELDFAPFFGKAECGYQELQTSFTKTEAHFIYGYSVGLSW